MPHAHTHARPAPLASVTRRAVVLTAVLAIALSLFVSASPRAEGTTTGLLSLRSSVVHLTNVARAAKGCRPLKVSTRLTKAAQYHANDMSRKDYFSHQGANGTPWHQRIRNFGWSNPGGENIAYGYRYPSGVLKGWMDSPGHRRNIMDCNFKWIGVGYAADGRYWVQDFGYGLS